MHNVNPFFDASHATPHHSVAGTTPSRFRLGTLASPGNARSKVQRGNDANLQGVAKLRGSSSSGVGRGSQVRTEMKCFASLSI